MTEREKGFSVSHEQGIDVYRRLRTGSAEIGRSRARVKRERLQAQLGIDRISTSSPTNAVLGQLLIAYVNVSSRLRGILSGENPMAVEDRINEQLTVLDGETPQQTFERLLNTAIENSGAINNQKSS